MLNVGEDRKRRCVEELGVQALVDDRHDGAHGVVAARGCIRGSPARACAGAADRPSPVAAAPRPGRRDRGNTRSSPRSVSFCSERMKSPMLPSGGADHAGAPAHHVIAREQDLGALQREAQVIGRVPRRVQRRDRPAVPLQPLRRRQAARRGRNPAPRTRRPTGWCAWCRAWRRGGRSPRSWRRWPRAAPACRRCGRGGCG